MDQYITSNSVYSLKQEEISPQYCVGASYLEPFLQKVKQISMKKYYTEGFVLEDEKGHEFRKQITNLPSNKLEGVQGQLQIKFEEVVQGQLQDVYYVGSGTLCIFWQCGFEKYFLLTCAHNVLNIHQGLSKKIETASTINYFYSREDEKKYFCHLKSEKFLVHEGYQIKSNPWEGFDLALIKLEHNSKMKNGKAPLSKNSRWGDCIENSGAKPGSIIKVIGYPAEYNGNLYQMEGNIKEIRSFDDGHAIILYDNINTSGGQSGSPVYLKTPDNIWTIIGVHVGYDSSINCNIATAITKVVLDWIYEQQNQF